MENKSQIEKIAVHDGAFHTDDIFAVGALLHLTPKLQILRTRNPKILEEVDMRIDVGMKYNPETGDYDHHQGAGARENGVPYAAFGLIWKNFGSQICESVMRNANLDKGLFKNNIPEINPQEISDVVDKRLVQPIDFYDVNGYPKNLDNNTPLIFLQYVMNSSLSNWYLNEDQSNDTQFLQNINFAKTKIKENVLNAQGEKLALGLCNQAYEQSKNNGYDKIVVMNLNKLIPAGSLSSTDALYCVQKQINGKYSVKAITKLNSYDSKKPLPSSWAGKKDEELANLTGVKDSVFCFKDFLIYSKSLEGAIKLAEIARDANN